MSRKQCAVPARVTLALDPADKPAQAKYRKMWRRWINRGWTLKSKAAKRWEWIKGVAP